MEIARALASDPELLLLDEPTAGMNPQESARLTEFMEQLREERALTILLIEHDMKVVMGVSEHITVLDHGKKIAEGQPEEIRANERVIEAYLGKRESGAGLMALLELDDIHTYYGNIEALKGISLKVDEGEIVTLIGSNGAGKSTTLRSISGLTPPREGSIQFEGSEIGETAPQDIVRLGISQSPEGRHCFPRMTVRENLDLGAYLRRDGNVERTWSASSSCSRGSRSASTRRRARCPAASSRCSRSAGR